MPAQNAFSGLVVSHPTYNYPGKALSFIHCFVGSVKVVQAAKLEEARPNPNTVNFLASSQLALGVFGSVCF